MKVNWTPIEVAQPPSHEVIWVYGTYDGVPEARLLTSAPAGLDEGTTHWAFPEPPDPPEPLDPPYSLEGT